MEHFCALLTTKGSSKFQGSFAAPILCLLLAISAAAEIRVTDFGAVPDGHSDSAPAVRRALTYASRHEGTKVLFPCNSGNTYVIRTSITFPSFTTIEGDSAFGCRILYDPPGEAKPADAAFSFVGSKFVAVRDLMLQTGPHSPPSAIVELGGEPGAAGQNTLESVSIKGFASKALSYSIASEVNTWRNVYWEYDGGGAKYGFYTSGHDDLHICGACKPASNLSLFFSTNTFVVFTDTTFTAIADKVGGGTGDHYYRDSYIGLNRVAGSIGFELISGDENQGGPNTALHLENVRIENGGFALYLKKASQSTLYQINVEGLTWVSSLGDPGYFLYGETGLTLAQCHMAQNVANSKGVTGRTSVDGLKQCTIDESYGSITVRRLASGNSLTMRGGASFELPRNASNNVTSASPP